MLMTKAPRLGSVKSRLSNEIGDIHAVEVYKCFLLDIIETLVQLGEDFIIYYTPRGAKELLSELLGNKEYKLQSGSDLGERLYNGMEMANELNYKYCIALASDVPDITVDYLRWTVESLKTHDVVVGPSTDGGYNLIGLDLDLNSIGFLLVLNGEQTLFMMRQ